jgi:hypothetical protein
VRAQIALGGCCHRPRVASTEARSQVRAMSYPAPALDTGGDSRKVVLAEASCEATSRADRRPARHPGE